MMDALNAGKWDESKVEVVVCPVALQAAAMAAIAKPGIKVRKVEACSLPAIMLLENNISCAEVQTRCM